MSQVTKRALEASLKHLLLQKPLDKITIGDITEAFCSPTHAARWAGTCSAP